MRTSSPKFHYAWIILTIATLVVFGALGLARFGYTVILPEMQSGLKLNNTEAGMLATANLVGYLMLSAVGGALAARFGPRVVITLGLLLTAGGMILTGLASGFFMAAVWRSVTGIGSGASNVPVMGLLTAWFTRQRRGMAAGIAVMGSSLGLISAGPIVPILMSAYGEHGWRVSWIIFGGVVFILAIVSFFLLRNTPSEMGLTPVGATSGPAVKEASQEKIRWHHVYRSASVWHLGFIYVAYGFSYIIYMTFFTKFLITKGEYTPESAGNLLMIVGWLSLFCGLIWGSLSDFIGRKYTLITVYLIHAVSFMIFGIYPEPAGFMISAILFGLSAWSIPAIMAAACGDILGPRLSSAALGFITLFLGAGQALGPIVAGAIADASGSFVPAFLLASGVSFLGAAGSYIWGPIHGTRCTPVQGDSA